MPQQLSDEYTTRRPSHARAGTSRQGMVTVEFALCASIFFMFIFGMLELTRYIYMQHSVQMVAYEAARAGVVPGATVSDVQTRAANLMAATGINVYTMNVTPTNINTLTENVSVTIHCNFADNSWVPPFFITSQQMESTISLQHENMAYLQPGDTDLASIIGDNDSEPIDQ
jgi:Flp pilus assembly protein TadG